MCIGLPKIYIMTKLLSVENPAMKRANENITSFLVNIVMALPRADIKCAIIRTGNLPISSANIPKNNVPTTLPMKNIDCPVADFQAF